MYTILSIITALVVVSTIPFVLSYETATGTLNQPIGDYTIPTWVKNTADWWSDDEIDDGSFVAGLQWLISNGIISLPPMEQGVGDGDNIIPGWIKSTAGWWAEDQIHDITFVAAIKYLIAEGIIIIEQEEEVIEELMEETVEVKEFDIIVNGHSCFSCTSWTYVGEEYHFQIETYDKQHGKYIDGVTITAKIISNDGELKHDFGTIVTEDGIYQNSITIPNMDWYADNIFAVTAEHNGIEKTVEKEFEVFNAKKSGFGSELKHNHGTGMYIAGNAGDTIDQYTLSAANDVSSGSFVDSFSIASEDDFPSGVSFSNNGK